MIEPSAKVIAHSVHHESYAPAVATLEVVMHRYVLAEFNTHRDFSRNSASSRAIPVHRQLERVQTDPAIPLTWPAERPGMQGGDPLDDSEQAAAEAVWIEASRRAAQSAESLSLLGVHKSVTNRLLEPFMWHTVVVTSTAWDNFFEQRCSPLAQPEIRRVAERMRDALAASRPRILRTGQFHKPYIDGDDLALVAGEHNQEDVLCKMSAARCCRVSREAQGGGRSLEDDMKTYDRLINPGEGPSHWSPLEHVCRAKLDHEAGIAVPGNLRGWVQLRHIVSKEI